MNTPPSPENNVAKEDQGKSAHQSRVRRRNRMITSCLECRRRKLKCDKLHPCTNCSKSSRDCLFLAPALDSVSQQRLNEIKEKMGSLERVLEQDIVRKEGRSTASSASQPRRTSTELPGGGTSSSDNDAAIPEDEIGLEPTPMAVMDASYEDDANDDVLDLGVKIGRMRLNERLGGFFRPRIHEEVLACFFLDAPTTDTRQLSQTLSTPSTDSSNPLDRRTSLPKLPDHDLDFLAPGPTYIAPGSGFLFGDVGSKRSLINFLPSKGAADNLVRTYHENVHFIARVVHWPSFQLHYDNFWTSVLAGLEPPAWQQALVLSILFAAVASMADEEVSLIFARPKPVILGNFQTGTEVALSKAQFLRATKFETLQALVVYLIPMCRDQVSRAHSVLVGMAVRLAECMGLHRDPEDVYGMSPIDCHVRRIVWFELCWLDFRTCEGQGPRPGIKREDYDAKFPLNINDADLLSARPQETNAQWTDMTMSRIRFECIEMQRIIWFDRVRIERKKASLTHVLGKIESFRRAMVAKYTPILNVEIPLQKYARLVMILLIQRMYVMVLHRYLNNPSNRVPERLRHLTIHSGVQATENAIALERISDIQRWRWFNGAYQQWHMAFLLLTVVHEEPTLREAERIWNILEFVFEPDPSLSRTMKSRSIISAIRDRTAVYKDLRRTRVPVSMKVGLDTSSRPTEAVGSTGDAMTTERAPEFVSSTVADQKPANVGDAAEQSWSFDTPATFYVSQRRPGLDAGASEPILPQRSQQQQPQTSSAHQFDFNSPSDSGTNESWPPLIMNDQTSWRTVLDPSKASSAPSSGPRTKTTTSMPAGGSPYGFGSGFPSDEVNVPQFPPPNPRGDSIMLDIDWVSSDRWPLAAPCAVET
ncbi:hypothetical protein A1O1_00584 [Capronia coronata CBS 617.96]|uniref:Zn(2)-C6 fungal-type domain-containing protein n=1 Tax=Capronia coronata CBS 617.96 TaxID=1182541 RepID=W9YRF2_9EURO|nr:uncharacterized protein A1O1_00584 [Capronia coronata CBS 617.96]EXJ95462.1 hypothetical protein A1O1_00584 [Capronia coronata CBS 617.96]